MVHRVVLETRAGIVAAEKTAETVVMNNLFKMHFKVCAYTLGGK